MKPRKLQLLPTSPGGKLVAIIGYLVAALGLYCTVGYFLGPGKSCIADNRAQITTFMLWSGLIQLAVVIGTLVMIRALNKHTGSLYMLITVLALAFIFVAQFLGAIGIAFGVGTACTT